MTDRLIKAAIWIVVLTGSGALALAVFGLIRHLVLYGFDGLADCG